MKLLQDMCELASESKDTQVFITIVAHKSIKEYTRWLRIRCCCYFHLSAFCFCAFAFHIRCPRLSLKCEKIPEYCHDSAEEALTYTALL